MLKCSHPPRHDQKVRPPRHMGSKSVGARHAQPPNPNLKLDSYSHLPRNDSPERQAHHQRNHLELTGAEPGLVTRRRLASPSSDSLRKITVRARRRGRGRAPVVSNRESSTLRTTLRSALRAAPKQRAPWSTIHRISRYYDRRPLHIPAGRLRFPVGFLSTRIVAG